jgi:hypothetical protein
MDEVALKLPTDRAFYSMLQKENYASTTNHNEVDVVTVVSSGKTDEESREMNWLFLKKQNSLNKK